MTDKMNDDELLKAFFADCQMSDIPDDGFSDRVMAALPVEEQVAWDAQPVSTANRKLERLWTAACVAIGIVAAVVCQGWEQIQALFFSMKIDFLISGSRALTHVAESVAHAQNLWMMMAGAVVLCLVWGYNELMDARQ